MTFSITEENTQIPEITITGTCLGGTIITDIPEWITLENVTDNNSDPSISTNAFSYKLKLALTEENESSFPKELPSAINIKIANKQSLDKTTTVNVDFKEIASAEEITNFDGKKGASDIRVNTNGKTLSLITYSMFKVPELSHTYNSTYCNDTNGGKTWLESKRQTTTEIVNNRRKYVYDITVKESNGTDAKYQLHQSTIVLSYNTQTIKSYNIWRGASFYGYPVDITKGSGSAYYSAIKKEIVGGHQLI